jgi:predicted secreted hydrolase
MNNRRLGLILLIALVGTGLVAYLLRPTGGAAETTPRFTGLNLGDLGGFATVTEPIELTFPADHGPHPDYLTEWWYYTGNLQTDDGRHFGYQLTFFRRALLPADQRAERASPLALEQLYMAHFALTDTGAQQFSAFERFERGTAGLAGAQDEPGLRVWLQDWQVEQTGPGEYRLQAAQDGVELDLTLIDTKGPILQGDRGYSPKGSEAGNASIYISQTRLATTGQVTAGGATFDVRGQSWMDHEFSTSALGPGLIGWDWFSLQLSDGSEVMLFLLRREDGQLDPFSSGTLIAPDGQTRSLSAADFQIEPTGEWRSPRSGATYPSGWEISIPSADLSLTLEPRLKDQELNLSFTYWEGAVRVSGERAGAPLDGAGYVELTGYAQSMQGQF